MRTMAVTAAIFMMVAVFLPWMGSTAQYSAAGLSGRYSADGFSGYDLSKIGIGKADVTILISVAGLVLLFTAKKAAPAAGAVNLLIGGKVALDMFDTGFSSSMPGLSGKLSIHPGYGLWLFLLSAGAFAITSWISGWASTETAPAVSPATTADPEGGRSSAQPPDHSAAQPQSLKADLVQTTTLDAVKAARVRLADAVDLLKRLKDEVK